MKVIVASDSHGNKNLVDELFKTEKFDCFIFCGDGITDFENHFYDNRLVLISGNCDWFSKYPTEQSLFLLTKKVFITHGNKYFVKSTLSKLVKEAKDISANIVLYGHTHFQKIENIDGIYFINPGTLKLGQYVTIEVQETGQPIIEQHSKKQ